MGLRELLEDYVSTLPVEVKEVILETIRIENDYQDVENPKQAKDEIRRAIEARATTYGSKR